MGMFHCYVSLQGNHTHTILVWYIYLKKSKKTTIHAGKYTSPIDPSWDNIPAAGSEATQYGQQLADARAEQMMIQRWSLWLVKC